MTESPKFPPMVTFDDEGGSHRVAVCASAVIACCGAQDKNGTRKLGYATLLMVGGTALLVRHSPKYVADRLNAALQGTAAPAPEKPEAEELTPLEQAKAEAKGPRRIIAKD